jgi:hypothetical protein
MHSIPTNYISPRSILILSCHIRLGLLVVSFLLGFSPKLCIPLLSRMCYVPCLSLIISCGQEYKLTKLSIMQFSPASYHFSSRKPKYSPQPPCSLTPSVCVRLLCRRLSLTLMHSYRESCSSVLYFNNWQQLKNQNFLKLTVASITRI